MMAFRSLMFGSGISALTASAFGSLCMLYFVQNGGISCPAYFLRSSVAESVDASPVSFFRARDKYRMSADMFLFGVVVTKMNSP